jgi:DNA-binding NarL/FixJ family response regulator
MMSTAAAARETSVLIVAKSVERRAELRALLSGDSEFKVIDFTGESPHGTSSPTRVVLVDLEDDLTPPISTLPASRTGIVVLIENPDLYFIEQILPPEPIAVLRRDCDPKQLAAAVHAVSAGLTALEANTAERWLRPPPDTIDPEPGEEELTSRETEVLHMMTAGLTNREIGSTLGISEHTVKFHIASIFGKLGTSTRTEAVTEGIRRGLILL